MTDLHDPDGGALAERQQAQAAISASQLFDQKRTTRFAAATVFALALVVSSAVAWSSVMSLAEVSTSAGEVVTSEPVRRVQHLEGGIVSEVLVKEGEEVRAGQPLLVLAPQIAETELSQLRTRHAAVQVRIDLLTATLSGDLPRTADADGDHYAIVVAEIRALEGRRESYESQVAVLRQQLAERRAEVVTLDSRASALTTQIELAREKIEAQRTLVESGNFPRLRIIDGERDFLRLVGEQSEVETDKLQLAERIREAEARIAELRAIFLSELASEISILTNEAAELQLAILQAEDRVGRLIVVAPLAGRVQDLQVRSDGGVVAPGATLMHIVPANADLRVEARVSTGDVGHVAPGQPVQIKVQTYDYSRFGKVDGQIAQLSPTTFLDADGRPYFKAMIDLLQDHVGADETLKLAPGMTVTADIITGERTLLDYLATPILKSLDSGLRER